MPRLQVYDAQDLAKSMVRRFNDRPIERRIRCSFTWPQELQNIGDSLGIAYSSDKWEPKDAKGKRAVHRYKHLAESRNRAFVRSGLLVDADSPKDSWPVYGDVYSMEGIPLPNSFAILGLFLEINLCLYVGERRGKPIFSQDPDEGVVATKVRHGMVGGSEILWSKHDPEAEDEPFVFVYTPKDGVVAIVMGDALEITKDGIAG